MYTSIRIICADSNCHEPSTNRNLPTPTTNTALRLVNPEVAGLASIRRPRVNIYTAYQYVVRGRRKYSTQYVQDTHNNTWYSYIGNMKTGRGWISYLRTMKMYTSIRIICADSNCHERSTNRNLPTPTTNTALRLVNPEVAGLASIRRPRVNIYTAYQYVVRGRRKYSTQYVQDTHNNTWYSYIGNMKTGPGWISYSSEASF